MFASPTHSSLLIHASEIIILPSPSVSVNSKPWLNTTGHCVYVIVQYSSHCVLGFDKMRAQREIFESESINMQNTLENVFDFTETSLILLRIKLTFGWYADFEFGVLCESNFG